MPLIRKPAIESHLFPLEKRSAAIKSLVKSKKEERGHSHSLRLAARWRARSGPEAPGSLPGETGRSCLACFFGEMIENYFRTAEAS